MYPSLRFCRLVTVAGALALSVAAAPPVRAQRVDASEFTRCTTSFVLDTLGQADMTTFRVLQSDNPLFTDAVRTALPGLMYSPATLRDQKVPVLVQQSFHFRQQSPIPAPR